jgi:hypothetical protein
MVHNRLIRPNFSRCNTLFLNFAKFCVPIIDFVSFLRLNFYTLFGALCLSQKYFFRICSIYHSIGYLILSKMVCRLKNFLTFPFGFYTIEIKRGEKVHYSGIWSF